MYLLIVYQNADIIYQQKCFTERDADEQGWRVCAINKQETFDRNINYTYEVRNIG